MPTRTAAVCPPAKGYQNAVLNIQTAVTVTLAEKRVPVREVIDLVPGSMLTFNQHCDSPLTLAAGGHAIATGETVKIGDKFGLRIRQLVGQDRS